MTCRAAPGLWITSLLFFLFALRPAALRGRPSLRRSHRTRILRETGPTPPRRPVPAVPRRPETEGRAAARFQGLGSQGREYRPGGRPGEARGKPAGRRDQLRRALPDAAEVEAPCRGDRHLDAVGRAGRPLAAARRPESRLRQPASTSRSAPGTGASSRSASPPRPRSGGPSGRARPVDDYVLAALEAKGLAPAPEADRRTLIRRVTFDLIGLPPTPAEIDAFLADESPRAYEKVVDRLLASPHYGERWGRHWLDLVRFAETAGHEFDYDTLEAYRYRDYVIRAFNADVPYDQFVIEHVAGDLLETPRRHPTEGFNESILGTGFFLLGEGTHSPVDVSDDEAARVDNQIDVLSQDLPGPDRRLRPLPRPQVRRDHDEGLLRPCRLPAKLAASARLHRSSRADRRQGCRAGPDQARNRAQDRRGPEDGGARAAAPGRRPLGPVRGLRRADVRRLVRHGRRLRSRPDPARRRPAPQRGPGRSRPFVSAGAGAQRPHLRPAPGRPPVADVHDREEVHPLPRRGPARAGQRRRRRLREDPRPDLRRPDVRRSTRRRSALAFAGREHVDRPPGVHRGRRRRDGQFHRVQTAYFGGDGFVAVDEIRFSDEGPPADGAAVRRSSRRSKSTPGPRRCGTVTARLKPASPPPTLALALTDGTGEDEHVHIRGSHRTLGDVVPRRFLEALGGDSQPAAGAGSGRLELARRVVDPANPLTARVLVNRLWKHHFGEGIVEDPRRLRPHGTGPDAPRAARLPGRSVRRAKAGRSRRCTA